MNLKEEVKKNGYNTLESVSSTKGLLNGIIDTYNAGITVNESKEKTLTEGLCVSCDNRGNCQWEENNKIYCEQYQ
ncbi:hypothetical protein [Flavobacterium sp. 102]|uniref:hypothetical protein n=1 Tax=Flavobacterium sp. 102 TaxID=2135623 RepID=UPI000EACEF99|nr:hypothetical protein [Flavobacterium sp. 102]RKS03152.1 hypothetical protein C8C84_2894 [Flavobacterium sp. 102]